ncbi:hypothetical protein [Streptosporangium pseudovulgare]|uniref:DUF3618 domain-containing protein n=1 Tax=Streptosporangium pseudovulgare TaxID=35765 RepID=A0ABQ2R3Z3_9ACTN|nr:hypothetical protein [Streptosporangium pseudovulgare]GGQ12451.1 hypothetical protein GCM10010140_48400 [Streptosporangium pseudovulgare]
MNEFPAGTGERSTLSDQPHTTTEHAKAAVGEVAETAKDQTRAVAHEARYQAQNVVGQLRDRVGEQSRHQSRRAAQGIRQWADDLSSMTDAAKPDSPVTNVVHQVAGTGRRAADYLEQEGLAGVVRDVQNFARRRPGAFLMGAVAAGFLVGRMAKATTASQNDTSGTAYQGFQDGYRPQQYAQPAQPYGRPTGTQYPSAQPYTTDGTYTTADAYGSAEPYPSSAQTRPTTQYPSETPPSTAWDGEPR